MSQNLTNALYLVTIVSFIVALLEHLAPGGELHLDFSDEITSGACVAGQPAEAVA